MGVAEALLRYVPFAEEEDVEVEIYYGLDELVLKGGPIPAVVRKALADPEPTRRAIAACIVARRGSSEDRSAVAALLKDKNPLVRLRAAQGLLAVHDKSGVEALIHLLNEPDVAISWSAEELLHWVAGENAPSKIVGAATAQERAECRAAWDAWHKERGAKLDLARHGKDGRRPGLIFLGGEEDYKDEKFPLWLCGSDGQPRWKKRDAAVVYDVQFLPGNRLLMSEYVACEKALDGKLLWRAKVPGSERVQRLVTGRTFIRSDRGSAALLDPAGAPIWSRARATSERDRNYPRHEIGFAERLANGRLAWLHFQKDRAEFISAYEPITDTILKQTSLSPPQGEEFVRGQVLANDRCLMWSRKIKDPHALREHPVHAIEFGSNGKPLPAATPSASHFATLQLAAFLRNGNAIGRREYFVRDPYVEEREKDLARITSPLLREYLMIRRNGPTMGPPAAIQVRRPARGERPGGTGVSPVRTGETPVPPGMFEPAARLIGEYDRRGKKVWEAFVPFDPKVVRVCLPLVRFGFDLQAEAVFDLDAVDRRIKQLRDKDPVIRHRAALMLTKLGANAEAAMPVLLELAKGFKQPLRREYVGYAFEVRGPNSLPVLLDLIKGKDTLLRWLALEMLWHYPEHPKDVVPVLLEVIKDRDPLIRGNACAASSWFLRERELVEALIARIDDRGYWFDDDSRTVGWEALVSLRNAGKGPGAAMTVRAGMQTLKSKDRRLAKAAIGFTLGGVAKDSPAERPGILATFREILDGDDAEFQNSAANAVAIIGTDAISLVPALCRVLKRNPNRELPHVRSARLSTLDALQRMGPSAKGAVDQVMALLCESPDAEERRQAIFVLHALGAPAKMLVPLLKELEQNEKEDEDVRRAASKVLEELQP